MSASPLDVASLPDLVRLATLPVFGWIALTDIKTRRVPNRTWYPLAALGFLLLTWEAYSVFTGSSVGFRRQRFLIQVAISIGFIIPLSYGFWLIGGFGGADAKAFFVIAVLFPTYPAYNLWQVGFEGALTQLPLVTSTIGVFSLTILSNTVIAGIGYPIALAGRNALTGYVSPGMFIAKPIAWDEVTGEYGTLLEFPERRFRDDLSLSGIRSYVSWRGLDLDALRMYLQWRGAELAEIRANPGRFRDPASLPAEPNPPGDGSLATDSSQGQGQGRGQGQGQGRGQGQGQGRGQGQGQGRGQGQGQSNKKEESTEEMGGEEDYEDPWGAGAFLEDIEGDAYGTTPRALRDGLEELATAEVVWISPGIPFLVPLFGGLLLSVTVGDILFALLDSIGFV